MDSDFDDIDDDIERLQIILQDKGGHSREASDGELQSLEEEGIINDIHSH